METPGVNIRKGPKNVVLIISVRDCNHKRTYFFPELPNGPPRFISFLSGTLRGSLN